MVAKDRTGHFCAWRACSTACEVSLGKDLLVAASCETKRLPNQRFIDHWTNAKCLAESRSIATSATYPGAYTVRYLFVTCGFSLAETENLGRRFLLGRALEQEGSEPF